MAGPLAPTPGTTMTDASARSAGVAATEGSAPRSVSALRMLTRLPAP